MNIFIAVIFGITALLGFFLLSYVLTDKNTPKGVALIHGFFAAIGILALAYYSYYNTTLLTCLILFILAAGGGYYLFGQDLAGKKIPKWLAVGHGSIAMIALGLLIIFLFF